MRALPLLISLFVGLGMVTDVRAQTTTFDSSRATPVNAGTGLVMLEVIESDAPAATPELADALLRALGRPWREVAPELVAPDTSTVKTAHGDVIWSVPGYPVDGFSAFVQRGIVESVRLDFTNEGPDLSGFADRLYARHGSPRPDGFYATDQTGFPFSLSVDRRANRLDARAVPGQLVGDDVPLPVQFSTVVYEAVYEAPEEAEVVGSGDASSSEILPPDSTDLVQGANQKSDSVYAYVDTPPEIVGGLTALQASVVYPDGATGDGIAYVQMTVQRDGSAVEAVVVRSTDPQFNEAALAAIRQVRYDPGVHRGTIVRSQLTVPVRFLRPPEPDQPDLIEIVEPQLVLGLQAFYERVDYPEESRRAGVSGRLVLTFVVERDGQPRQIELNASASTVDCGTAFAQRCRSARALMVSAARKAVLTSSFTPGTRNGEPIEMRHQLPVVFKLR